MNEEVRNGDGELAALFRRWSRMLWRIGFRPALDRMLDLELTAAESMTLRSLQRGPLTVAQVANVMHLSHSAASRAVDRLVGDGFIQRAENSQDRRRKHLTLAEKGRTLLDEWDTAFANGLTVLVDALDPAEQEQWKQLLRRMVEAHASKESEPTGRMD